MLTYPSQGGHFSPPKFQPHLTFFGSATPSSSLAGKQSPRKSVKKDQQKLGCYLCSTGVVDVDPTVLALQPLLHMTCILLCFRCLHDIFIFSPDSVICLWMRICLADICLSPLMFSLTSQWKCANVTRCDQPENQMDQEMLMPTTRFMCLRGKISNNQNLKKMEG